MVSLTQECAEDWWQLEALFNQCFAPGREALSSYRLRESGPPVGELCRVVRDQDGFLVGGVRHWPVRIGDERSGGTALLLGPIAVHPTRQSEGICAMMMNDTQNIAIELGWERRLLVGDLPYYGRFGFERLDGVHMPPPTDPKRILGQALVDGAWDTVRGSVMPWARGDQL